MASARQPPGFRVERLDVYLLLPGVVCNECDRPAIWCKDREPLPPRADQQWNQLTFPCQINQVDVWVLPVAGMAARNAGLRDEPAVRGPIRGELEISFRNSFRKVLRNDTLLQTQHRQHGRPAISLP